MRFVGWILLGFGNLFTWLFLPPIFLFISKPINKLWVRCILFIVSPMTIYLCSEWYDSWERRHRYDSCKEISDLICFDFPFYHVVSYEEKAINTHLKQGYDVTKTVCFDKSLNPAFYAFIDSLCFEQETGWETEQYVLIYRYLVKQHVDKWGEDSLHLYIDKWDSIAKNKARQVPNNKYLYHGPNFQLQLNKNSNLVLIKYFDGDWESL